MSYGPFALKRYFVRLTTFVIESISPKFSILTILPISVECRASKASMFFGISSGFCSENSFAKSGMYASPMHPIMANHKSCFLLKIFWARYVVGSEEG